MSSATVLFLGKADDPYAAKAQSLLAAHFPKSTFAIGKRGAPLPDSVRNWHGDYILSYLSPWIIPESVLKAASQAAINFHPGSPEYPGIGCTNFAIFNEEQAFGVTCHHMAATVDTGPIIAVRRFAVSPEDSVFSLTQRCYQGIESLFAEIVLLLAQQKPLPKSPEAWTRRPYTRKELNALCRIEPSMGPDEVRRRVRATTFPGYPGAYLVLAEHRFEYVPKATVTKP